MELKKVKLPRLTFKIDVLEHMQNIDKLSFSGLGAFSGLLVDLGLMKSTKLKFLLYNTLFYI